MEGHIIPICDADHVDPLDHFDRSRTDTGSDLTLSADDADDCSDALVRESVVSSRGLDPHVCALTCSLLLMSIGCAVKPGSQAGGVNPILGGGISDDFDALAFVDPEVRGRVEDCIDNAKLKIYTGDSYWQSTWIDVGESDVGIRDFCENLATRDPATLDEIHDDWAAWEEFVAAQNDGPGSTEQAP